MAWVHTYTYLFLTLWGLLLFAVGLAIYTSQRRAMLLSGLLSAPYALASVLFVPEYWNPVRIATFFAGPEDVIFSFANGGLVWALSAWIVERRLRLGLHAPTLVARFVCVSLLGITCSASCRYLLSLDVMAATMGGIAMVGLFLLWMRRELWPMALTGAISFSFLYTLLAGLGFLFWPDFLLQWHPDIIQGASVLALPIEEVIWACGYGAVWPLFMAYAFDARLEHAGTHDAKRTVRRFQGARAIRGR